MDEVGTSKEAELRNSELAVDGSSSSSSSAPAARRRPGQFVFSPYSPAFDYEAKPQALRVVVRRPGVPYASVPRRNKPRRVDLYYSSWHIRAVESKRDGQLTACQILLFRHEDMGIPWEIAKLGVRQRMWGAVKKIDPGLRAYQRERESGAPLSRCAFMAQINTKVSADYLRSLECKRDVSSSEVEAPGSTEKPLGRSIPKLLVVVGAVALACSLDQGLLTKAVIFGVAGKFAMIGKKWL